MFKRTLLALAALALVAASCGSDDAADTPTTTTTTAPAATTTTAAPAASTAVAITSSALGDIVVDGSGNTLYLFTPDTPGEASNCNGDCAAAWPPLTGTASAGNGIDASLLGTVTRDDGAVQPTYNGWPLYYFAADTAPGDTNGQSVGDVWWVIDGTGNPIIPTSPSALSVSDQDGDGTSVTIDAVTLPARGYVVIHADGGGSPGAVIGHTDLLAKGESTGVVVTLDSPLTATGIVFPMVHIDADGDGVYEFAPPDVTVDVPGLFENGSVAVLPLTLTVASPEAAAALSVATNPLGDILVDADGRTLYLFTVDTQGSGASNCTDGCADNWPALRGDHAAGDGVDAGLLTTITRGDGSTQVTYNGWPLYYFAGDEKPGDTNGQGLGDVWWVVDASGDAVQ